MAGRRTTPEAPRLPEDVRDLPSVTILIAAFNAEKSIRERIENLLNCDYPVDRLAIVIASDGSTDETVHLAKETNAPNLTVLDYKERRGKAETLARSFVQIKSDIVLFTDVTSHFATGAIKNIARHFIDSSVGVVSGRVCMLTEDGQSTEGLYWRMESAVRVSEARLGVMTGVSGAIYAIRRSLIVAPDRPTINDDMVFPILAKHDHRCKYVLDNEAVAEVVVPRGIKNDFRRRRRIGLGVFQSLPIIWRVVFASDKLSAFCLVSHKILRWTVPFLLCILFVSNFYLYPMSFYKVLIWLELATIACAILGLRREASSSSSSARLWNRLCGIATSFYCMNLALLLGFFDCLFRSKKVIWEPTARPRRSLLVREVRAID